MPNVIPKTPGFSPPVQKPVAQAPQQAAAPVPSTPTGGVNAMADPSYQAYLRGMGVEEAEIQNILGTRIGALTRQLGRKLPAYAAQKEQAIKDTGQGFQSRGFFRGGERLAEQARVGLESDRERMDYEAEVRDQMAELYGTSAMDIARLRRELAEQTITGAQNTAIANATAGIY